MEYAFPERYQPDHFPQSCTSLEFDPQRHSSAWIYCLEQTAREELARHHEEAYWRHMEFLVAYIRKNAPWTASPLRRRRIQLASDIQACLTVLGRRERSVKGHGQPSLDLRRTDLQGARLPQACLRGLNLAGAHLEGANLWGADLEGAFLPRAHLEETFLAGAYLKEATLIGAHLENAFLRGADLRRASLTGAHLEGARLWGANLEEAILWGAHLSGADLWCANLQGADFTNVTGLVREQIVEAQSVIRKLTRLISKG